MTVQEIYDGSDGEATKALYAQLAARGPVGDIAVNLFRACKASQRAKAYRGGNVHGSYRSQAYGKKDWSLQNLCAVLQQHAETLRLRWGWQRDDATVGYEWALYVDIPTGFICPQFSQVSFHAPRRHDGPDYHGTWDGMRDVSGARICAWCEQLLASDAPHERPASSHASEAASSTGWCQSCAVWWSNRTRCPLGHGVLVAKPGPDPVPEIRRGVVAEW